MPHSAQHDPLYTALVKHGIVGASSAASDVGEPMDKRDCPAFRDPPEACPVFKAPDVEHVEYAPEPDAMRYTYRILRDDELRQIQVIKACAQQLHSLLDGFTTREMSLAKTKLEECVMWAVKGIST